jgi:peptide/nickel transport system substrate-binding protein
MSMAAIRWGTMWTAAALLATSCVAAGSPGSSGPAGAPRPTSPERVLTMSIEREPNYISPLAPIAGLAATDFYQRLFSAFLDYYDDQGRALPYLAEALPELNTDSWTVFPDGRMETRYRLKPNLVWHDGAPLNADDIAYMFQVATPAVGFRTGVPPYNLMASVRAPDDRTLVVSWKSVYPGAAVLMLGAGSTRFGLLPFPRHLLEPTFRDATPEVIQNSPYWAREFVGVGPYKLDRWELGSHLEAVAFDQHVLGRPKISRIRLVFTPDPNSAFAGLLAGDTQVSLNSIKFEHVLQLRREWAATNAGTAGFTAVSITVAVFQFKPEYANPRAIGDLRVRKALAHGVDKPTLNETLFGGLLNPLENIFDPTADYYPTIETAISKSPYDPRASERLMSDAGYSRGSDGFFASPSEGKATFGWMFGQNRPEGSVLAAGWRQIGFDIQEHALSQMLAIDAEVNSAFPAINNKTSAAEENQQMTLYRSAEMSTAENRWRGENRGGWTSPEYDRLVNAFQTTLDPAERVQQRAAIARMLSTELPSIVLAYNPNTHAYLAAVKGIVPTSLYTTGRLTWNIERWELP